MIFPEFPAYISLSIYASLFLPAMAYPAGISTDSYTLSDGMTIYDTVYHIIHKYPTHMKHFFIGIFVYLLRFS